MKVAKTRYACVDVSMSLSHVFRAVISRMEKTMKISNGALGFAAANEKRGQRVISFNRGTSNRQSFHIRVAQFPASNSLDYNVTSFLCKTRGGNIPRTRCYNHSKESLQQQFDKIFGDHTDDQQQVECEETQLVSTSANSLEDIANRRQKYHLRSRFRIECPACGSAAYRGKRMIEHMAVCCPDLLLETSKRHNLVQALEYIDLKYDERDDLIERSHVNDFQVCVARQEYHSQEQEILHAHHSVQKSIQILRAHESSMRRMSLKIKYGVDSGDGVVKSDEFVATKLGVDVKRAELLIRRGRKDIPLVVDKEPIEVIGASLAMNVL